MDAAQTATLKQILYGPAYVDDEVQIAMNQDPANATTGTNTENDCERFYYVEQDGNWNVIGLTAPSGDLVERYEYSAYGKRTVFGHGFRYASNHQSAQGPMLADFDGDGVVGEDDDDVMDAELAAPSAGSVADLNGDGLVNAADATIFDSWLYSDQGSADEQMMHVAGSSARMMLADGTTSFVALNELGHQGLMHDEETGLVYNRARYLSPTLERFTSPDPIGYPDGGNRYDYVMASPVSAVDPAGLAASLATKMFTILACRIAKGVGVLQLLNRWQWLRGTDMYNLGDDNNEMMSHVEVSYPIDRFYEWYFRDNDGGKLRKGQKATVVVPYTSALSLLLKHPNGGGWPFQFGGVLIQKDPTAWLLNGAKDVFASGTFVAQKNDCGVVSFSNRKMKWVWQDQIDARAAWQHKDWGKLGWLGNVGMGVEAAWDLFVDKGLSADFWVRIHFSDARQQALFGYLDSRG